MTGDSAVGSFGLHDLTIGGEQDTGHQSQGTITLGHTVTLNITIIVLTGPDETSVALHAVGDHVVNEAVLVPDASSLVLGLEVSFVHLLEQVLEATIVLLEDGVLGAQVQRPLLLESVLEAALGKSEDGLVSVVHAHGNTAARKVEHVVGLLGTAISRGEGELQAASALDDQVSGLVLVAVGVAANDNRSLPARYQAGHVLADDRLAEDRAAEDVPDRSVGALPHLLQLELCTQSLTNIRNMYMLAYVYV